MASRSWSISSGFSGSRRCCAHSEDQVAAMRMSGSTPANTNPYAPRPRPCECVPVFIPISTSSLFLPLLFIFGEHLLEQRGAHIFQPPYSLIDRRLVFKGETALDVPKFVGHFSHINLHILEALLGLDRGVTGSFGIDSNIFDGGSSRFDVARVVQLVSNAKLMLRDADAKFSPVFETRVFEAGFHLV